MTQLDSDEKCKARHIIESKPNLSGLVVYQMQIDVRKHDLQWSGR